MYIVNKLIFFPSGQTYKADIINSKIHCKRLWNQTESITNA